MHSSTIIGAIAAAFTATTHAHMIMNTPVPYGLKTLVTSPLSNPGTTYTFPCQGGSRTDYLDPEGASNPMTVGESNLLNFTGSVVHGGGSCQLSVTYDNPPPADKTKWKVIHSYIGSCPASAAGNLNEIGTDSMGRPDGLHCSEPDSDQTECVKSYDFKLPTGMKNGNATLAWTWFNKIGNREMYMNCAPISISGGSDDDTVFNALPAMFVANIPNECQTADISGVIGFPDPGTSVTYGEAITPNAQGSCAAAGSSNSSSDSTSDSSSSTAVSSSSAVASSSSAAARIVSTASIATTTMATAYATTSAIASASSTAASIASSSNSTCASGKVSCPAVGSVICIGTAQFGICDTDNCAVAQSLAAGTTCSGGSITKRDHVRRAKRGQHAHRHSF